MCGCDLKWLSLILHGVWTFRFPFNLECMSFKFIDNNHKTFECLTFDTLQVKSEVIGEIESINIVADSVDNSQET